MKKDSSFQVIAVYKQEGCNFFVSVYTEDESQVFKYVNEYVEQHNDGKILLDIVMASQIKGKETLKKLV